ncbi:MULTISPECIES: nuclear transport factor 2 family protein [unclassified Sphingomonas]|uniref:nuclear transport factor 2 family protein n=1 Tax=unclassified Sphingomonas TaxID=196159 RepID=UPI000A571680|nr:MULTISPECIES: nuclear transport factor 2 family protein [unclassified Sphingomonas]
MSDDLDAILRLEAARSQAIVDADIRVLNDITDTDYTHVEMNGRLRDKSEFLEALSSGAARFVRYDALENVVRFAGEAAIVTGRFENESVDGDGMSHVRQGRHCRIYVRRQDGWKNILHQGSGMSVTS